jgi:hypothetical protein
LLDQEIEKLRWRRGSHIANIRNFINRIVGMPFRQVIPKVREVSYIGSPEGTIGLEVKVIDLYATARWRQLALLKYFLEKTECKYLFIITSATYIAPETLLKITEDFGDSYLYAGPIHGERPGRVFVSGAQLVVNRKFATLALQERKKIPTHLLNDLGLGEFAYLEGIEPRSLPTVNLSAESEIEHSDEDNLKNNYHFRLKATDSLTGERCDVKLFRALHRKLKSFESGQ